MLTHIRQHAHLAGHFSMRSIVPTVHVYHVTYAGGCCNLHSRKQACHWHIPLLPGPTKQADLVRGALVRGKILLAPAVQHCISQYEQLLLHVLFRGNRAGAGHHTCLPGGWEKHCFMHGVLCTGTARLSWCPKVGTSPSRMLLAGGVHAAKTSTCLQSCGTPCIPHHACVSLQESRRRGMHSAGGPCYGAHHSQHQVLGTHLQVVGCATATVLHFVAVQIEPSHAGVGVGSCHLYSSE